MNVRWTDRSVDDLARLHEFLAPVNRRAAARVVQSLAGAASRLAAHARIGERLEQYQPREVRRILVGNYEMRYQVRGEEVVILRVWHTRQHR